MERVSRCQKRLESAGPRGDRHVSKSRVRVLYTQAQSRCIKRPTETSTYDNIESTRPPGHVSDTNVAMAAEPLSPMDFIAPARIKAQLLPVGRIRRSRFLSFVDLLRQQSLVRLGDVSPDPRPDRSTNPLNPRLGRQLLILASRRYVFPFSIS